MLNEKTVTEVQSYAPTIKVCFIIWSVWYQNVYNL